MVKDTEAATAFVLLYLAQGRRASRHPRRSPAQHDCTTRRTARIGKGEIALHSGATDVPLFSNQRAGAAGQFGPDARG